jgi:hypothetical protein
MYKDVAIQYLRESIGAQGNDDNTLTESLAVVIIEAARLFVSTKIPPEKMPRLQKTRETSFTLDTARIGAIYSYYSPVIDLTTTSFRLIGDTVTLYDDSTGDHFIGRLYADPFKVIRKVAMLGVGSNIINKDYDEIPVYFDGLDISIPPIGPADGWTASDKVYTRHIVQPSPLIDSPGALPDERLEETYEKFALDIAFGWIQLTQKGDGYSEAIIGILKDMGVLNATR